MKVARIAKPTAITVSSFITYNSCEIAVATRPVPRTTVPVLVIRLGEEGRLLMISEARSAGGGGFDELAIPRLDGAVNGPKHENLPCNEE